LRQVFPFVSVDVRDPLQPRRCRRSTARHGGRYGSGRMAAVSDALNQWAGGPRCTADLRSSRPARLLGCSE
jgi:hypothetical protein